MASTGGPAPPSNGPSKGFDIENGDPAQLIPRIYNFLRQEDVDRHAMWDEHFRRVKKCLGGIEKRRLSGHPQLLDRQNHLNQTLQQCHQMVKVHERFKEWKTGQTRWSTHLPVQSSNQKRLAPYDRQFPVPRSTDAGEKRPSLYTALVPRPEEVHYPPFIDFNFDYNDPNPDWDFYFRQPDVLDVLRRNTAFYEHANLFWRNPPGRTVNWEEQYPLLKNPSNPRAINYAELENSTYEDYVTRDIKQIAIPPPPGGDTTTLGGRASGGGLVSTTADWEEPARQRGYKRAALQTFLNILENKENRDINTPWRRVIFPEPAKKFTKLHYHPRTLPREQRGLLEVSNRSKTNEPSPWIFWYNQWLQQTNYLSAWTRKSYNKRSWTNFKQIAWPVNFRGPYVFSDKCIYDDYWLKMGKYLRQLQKNLEKASVTRKHWFLDSIVSDIEQGANDGPIPDEVMPRPGVDTVPDNPAKFQLVDEVDIAWLTFLCQPPATRALVGLSLGKPEDTLTILLDHRIQILFNDQYNSPFWVEDYKTENNVETFMSWRPYAIRLESLLPMLNLGGRRFVTQKWGNDGTSTRYQEAASFNDNLNTTIPNSYQFSLLEAKAHAAKLAEMSRLIYKCPMDPARLAGQQWYSGIGYLYYYPSNSWRTDGGYIAPLYPGLDPGTDDGLQPQPDPETNPMRYPEERIQWRHASRERVAEYNAELQHIYASEMVRRQRQSADRIQYSRERYMANFLEEITWKRGPDFDHKSVEHRRKAPSWDDLLDYRTVLKKDVGYSWRTMNFLRNLAYRMGRTIRFHDDLLRRTSLASAFTRAHLHAGLDQWTRYVDETWPNPLDNGDQTAIPFRASRPNAILERIDPKHQNVQSDDLTAVFRDIRNGIIDDMVHNRTMRYPSRQTLYSDRNKFLGEYFERANIWSWAHEPVRQRHAAYRRDRYFDMRRWPLNRQTTETQERITSRKDEDPDIQATSALYKFGLQVGPEVAWGEQIRLAIKSLKDSGKEKVATQLLQQIAKNLDPIMRKLDNDKVTMPWHISIAPALGSFTDAALQKKVKSMREPKQLFKPKERFIPGPARFPMGDSLLSQVKLSQELEKVLDPKPNTTTSKVLGALSGIFRPPPKRVPLLPDIDDVTLPPVNEMKRKLPESFLEADKNHKKIKKEPDVGESSDEDDDGDGTPGRGGVNPGGFRGGRRPVRGHLLGTGRDEASDDILVDDASSDSDVGDNGAAKSKIVDNVDGSFRIGVRPATDHLMNMRRTDKNKPQSVFGHAGHSRAMLSRPQRRTTAGRQPRRPVATNRRQHQNSPIIEPTATPTRDSGQGTRTQAPRSPRVAPPPPPSSFGAGDMDVLGRGIEGAEAIRRHQRQVFDRCFPFGFERLPTSAEGFECALHAMILSLRAQYPGRATPTVAELRNLFFHPHTAMAQNIRNASGLPNINNFSLDQAALTLWDWCMRNGSSYTYRLGVRTQEPNIWMTSVPDPGESKKVEPLWIHNTMTAEDLARELKDEKGKQLTPATIMGNRSKVQHFEGMAPKPRPL